MENTTLIGISRLATLQRQMDIVSNNVANMNTTGFKAETPVFAEFLEKPRRYEQYSMVQDYSTLRDISEGPMTMTSNPLDLAIEGDAYFTVSTMDGPRYSRSGNFSLNNDRQLVNAGGLPVLDENGNSITLPINTHDIRVDNAGNVSTENGILGKLAVVKFDQPQEMTQLGSGLYQTNQVPVPAEEAVIRQGMLEGSNVRGIVEMTNMIDVNRQYQNMQNLLKTEHDRLRNAYGKLSKLS